MHNRAKSSAGFGDFLQSVAVLFAALWLIGMLAGAAVADELPDNLVGMYIHQHWPYNYPYAARTWQVADYRGYCGGLKTLGYNTVMIWPLLETMPSPLTASDRASLKKIAAVIDMLHRELGMRGYIALCPNVGAKPETAAKARGSLKKIAAFIDMLPRELGMRVSIALCPNVGAKDEEAAKAPFEKRHFFYCDTRVNPADPKALAKLIARRKEVFRPLRKVDGVAIIDSDPGGYPGSTNPEFVNLLMAHRKMFDSLRPGIELVYWNHVGWPAYGRWYQTGIF